MTDYPTLTIRLPKATRDWLFGEASRSEVSVASIVKEALEMYAQATNSTISD